MDRFIVVGRKAREHADANEPELRRPAAVFAEEEGHRDDPNQETSEGGEATTRTLIAASDTNAKMSVNTTPVSASASAPTPPPHPEVQTRRRNEKGQRARILRLWKRVSSS